MSEEIVEYTSEDMKVLANMSQEGSVPSVYLPELKYDPRKFKQLLVDHHLKKDIHYLFEMPLEDIPLLINKGTVSGYLSFRLRVAK